MATTIHTAHHGKDDSGRSKEIESFIEQGAAFLASSLRNLGRHPHHMTFLDVGTDYGHFLKALVDNDASPHRLVGVDLDVSFNPYGLDLRSGSMLDPLLHRSIIPNIYDSFDVAVFNHTLEHVEDPHRAMRNITAMLHNRDGLVFLALPDASQDWAQWEGHYTAWTIPFMIHFMKMHGFVPVQNPEYRCFRGTNLEMWGLFVREEK